MTTNLTLSGGEEVVMTGHPTCWFEWFCGSGVRWRCVLPAGHVWCEHTLVPFAARGTK